MTSFNTSAMEALNIQDLVDCDVARYVCMSMEHAPTTGRIHYHLYIEFYSQKTMNTIKKILKDTTANIQPARGTPQEAVDYIKKDGATWKEAGTMSNQGHRSDLDDVFQRLQVGDNILDIIEGHPGTCIRYIKGILAVKGLVDQRRQRQEARQMPTVLVYIGKSGAGKSHACSQDPDYQRSGYKYPVQGPSKVYFDGYTGESTIWFDEFGGSVLPFHVFLRLADKYETRVETKGGSVCITGLQKILISTTTPPKLWWCESRKFNEDPYQLWRRLTRVYYIPRPSWGFADPVLIQHPENFDELVAAQLEREAETRGPSLDGESVRGQPGPVDPVHERDDDSDSERTIDTSDGEHSTTAA